MSGGNSKGDSVWKAGDLLMSQEGFTKEDPWVPGLTTLLGRPSTLVWRRYQQFEFDANFDAPRGFRMVQVSMKQSDWLLGQLG